jgi:hypothetical protein
LSWFTLSWHDATLFTILLFNALSHKRFYWLSRGKAGDMFRPQDTELLGFCELESIRMVNKAIQDPSRALSDVIILCVGSLANNSANQSVWDKNIRSPFQSPLRCLQWLNIFGGQLANPIHLTALTQLIRLRGGLENIELPGLAPILS